MSDFFGCGRFSGRVRGEGMDMYEELAELAEGGESVKCGAGRTNAENSVGLT